MAKVLSGHTLAHDFVRSSIVVFTHMQHISLLMDAIESCYFMYWAYIYERTLMRRGKNHVPLLFYLASTLLMEIPMVYSMSC